MVMRNVRVLDCTLRDGGRIINCAFSDVEIKDIAERLSEAKIDIVEVGFLRDWHKVYYKGDSTFFTDVDQIKPYIKQHEKNTMYVAFIDYGMFDFDSLKPYDGRSIDGIRFGFTKENYEENYEDLIRCISIIKERGYKLFVQGVNSLNYSDKEILELVEMINRVHPYSFGIVDTYGAMYIDDLDRIFGLIDHNMDSDICINFHSHNNYQLSFGLAQEVIKLSRGNRQIIIDSTLAGMGKVAGNLNTELFVDYLVRKMHYDYEFDDILDIIDDYIYPYAKKYNWGYSVPAMLAGIYKAHPNNIIYLTEKFRLDTKDIGQLLSMIDIDKRQRYDYDNIERLYIEYIADKVDDYETILKLKKMIGKKEVVILAPGNSLLEQWKEVETYLQNHGDAVVISVNFICDIEGAYAFFANSKRYSRMNERKKGNHVIVSSNIRSDASNFVINYHSLINRGYKYFENSTIMLLNLLKRLEVNMISIAGFDGFDENVSNNYMDASFQNERHVEDFALLNKEIKQMFAEYVEKVKEKCKIKFLTKSLYEL